MTLNAHELGYKVLNEKIRDSNENIVIDNCYGERFIGCGVSSKTIEINGTPGNALGAYLDGAIIVVNGNAQDAVGDTMNDGKIIIHGNAGDALGYAMRGGKIYVKGNAGYRTGIHMKQYQNKRPVIIVGGCASSFLGEYLAGGLIIILGLNTNEFPVGNYAGTVMHGGEIYIRSKKEPVNLPDQVNCNKIQANDMQNIMDLLTEYSELFNTGINEILNTDFYHLTPDIKNPLKQLYTAN